MQWSPLALYMGWLKPVQPIKPAHSKSIWKLRLDAALAILTNLGHGGQHQFPVPVIAGDGRCGLSWRGGPAWGVHGVTVDHTNSDGATSATPMDNRSMRGEAMVGPRRSVEKPVPMLFGSDGLAVWDRTHRWPSCCCQRAAFSSSIQPISSTFHVAIGKKLKLPFKVLL
jgi:hypothetical protein